MSESEQEAPTSLGNETQAELASAQSACPSTDSISDRQARFKALRARAKESAKSNRKEVTAESQRLGTDPNVLNNINRKHAEASYNLLKADTEAAGEDFERKRAWDYTIDEDEKWTKRQQKKQRHRENVAFQDFGQDANKVYKRGIKELKPDFEAYEKEKDKAIERAAASGNLEIVETDDGELVAVDKDGRFYTSADSTEFVENKPEKAAIDRLVGDLKKAEGIRLRKRRDRGQDNDDGDVTYINKANQGFNQRLTRFYNKYTTEIRESFERGTAI